MSLKEFSYNGKSYAGFTVETAQAKGVPIQVVEQAVLDTKWEEIRVRRDFLIKNTDWTQVPDSPLADEKKAEFTDYRQALRDIPQTYPNPDDVVWPKKPTI